jgi:Eukaryotic aspartyl protease
MDSGSSDLWVPSENCRSQACAVHETLGTNDSSTLQTSSVPWQIQYGTGSASGLLVADSLSIGGLTVNSMPFGVATQLSSNFAQFVHLAISGLTVRRQMVFLDSRLQQQMYNECRLSWINLYALLLIILTRRRIIN